MSYSRHLRALAASSLIGFAGVAISPAHAQEFLTIGTAGQTGVYYVVGQSVCQLVNRGSEDHGFRCTAPATAGSIANLNGIRAGDFNFGVVQSDWQYHALKGTSAFKEATVACDTVFLQVEGPQIDKLVEETIYYSKAEIPAGMYNGQSETIRTYGPLATLVSSTDTSDDAVYQIVKAIFDNFDRFKALHPAFASLDEKQMISNGTIAPLHDGAVRYYTERGWM